MGPMAQTQSRPMGAVSRTSYAVLPCGTAGELAYALAPVAKAYDHRVEKDTRSCDGELEYSTSTPTLLACPPRKLTSTTGQKPPAPPRREARAQGSNLYRNLAHAHVPPKTLVRYRWTFAHAAFVHVLSCT